MIFKNISYIEIEHLFTLFDLNLLCNYSKIIFTSDVTMDQNLHGNICLNIIALASILFTNGQTLISIYSDTNH